LLETRSWKIGTYLTTAQTKPNPRALGRQSHGLISQSASWLLDVEPARTRRFGVESPHFLPREDLKSYCMRFSRWSTVHVGCSVWQS